MSNLGEKLIGLPPFPLELVASQVKTVEEMYMYLLPRVHMYPVLVFCY